jgi:hypothetical protein
MKNYRIVNAFLSWGVSLACLSHSLVEYVKQFTIFKLFFLLETHGTRIESQVALDIKESPTHHRDWERNIPSSPCLLAQVAAWFPDLTVTLI